MLERKESGVTIDEGRVVKMTLAAAEILAKNLLGNFQFKNFVLMLQENEEKISEYTGAVSYTHLRAHETVLDLVCRLLLEKKKKNIP